MQLLFSGTKLCINKCFALAHAPLQPGTTPARSSGLMARNLFSTFCLETKSWSQKFKPIQKEQSLHSMAVAVNRHWTTMLCVGLQDIDLASCYLTTLEALFSAFPCFRSSLSQIHAEKGAGTSSFYWLQRGM
jgi:hypothetical protein